MARRKVNTMETRKADILSKVPMNRAGEPGDVVKAEVVADRLQGISLPSDSRGRRQIFESVELYRIVKVTFYKNSADVGMVMKLRHKINEGRQPLTKAKARRKLGTSSRNSFISLIYKSIFV